MTKSGAQIDVLHGGKKEDLCVDTGLLSMDELPDKVPARVCVLLQLQNLGDSLKFFV